MKNRKTEKRAPAALPSKDHLHQIFHYDHHAGLLVWKKTAKKSRCKPGDVAGYLITKSGFTYRMIGLDGKFYMAAHLIARMYLGFEPGHYIRYVGIDPLDTRLGSLVVADRSLMPECISAKRVEPCRRHLPWLLGTSVRRAGIAGG